ncbi:MAG: hypothetical protein LIR35_06095 [Bacteroidota bacterium]|nr:hypothetical protein [Bacteroidota bacterium]
MPTLISIPPGIFPEPSRYLQYISETNAPILRLYLSSSNVTPERPIQPMPPFPRPWSAKLRLLEALRNVSNPISWTYNAPGSAYKEAPTSPIENSAGVRNRRNGLICIPHVSLLSANEPPKVLSPGYSLPSTYSPKPISSQGFTSLIYATPTIPL